MDWIPLHAGHATLPVVPTFLALVGAVGVALLLRHLGVIDAITGTFVAGRARDEDR